MRKLTSYAMHTGKLIKPMTFIVVSDLHDEPYEDILPMLEGADALLMPGDIYNRYTETCTNGIAFMREAASRLPAFFSVGNHDIEHTQHPVTKRQKTQFREALRRMEGLGVEVLVNRYVRFGPLWIGGWYDPETVGVPDMMDAFERLDGCKVLLCHKPDEYMRRFRGRNVDLVVAGHAHGGQIRFLNQGIYAPGQFFFPKYTRGVVDGHMIISAGAGNPNGLPRWNNPCEVLRIVLD